MRKNIFVTLAVAGVATFALGACASTEGTGTTTEPEAGTNAPANPATDAPAEETPEAPAVTNPKFGETYTWESGIQATVGQPIPFTPGEYSLVEGATNYVYFDVKIMNGTAENFEPAMFIASLQSGNLEAEKVYDSGTLGDEPTTVLLPGREAVFKIGYAVSNPADLVMEFTPEMITYEDAIFTF